MTFARTVAYMAMVNREATRRNHVEGWEAARRSTNFRRAVAPSAEAAQREDDVLDALDGLRLRDRYTALDAARYRHAHPDEAQGA